MKFKYISLLLGTTLLSISSNQTKAFEATKVYPDQMNMKIGGYPISDHYMISSPIINNQNLQVKSYNAWARGTRCGFKEGRNILSSQEDNQRISYNSQLILANLQQNPNTFFGIQEWGNNDLGFLDQELTNNPQFAKIFTPTKGESFQHGIIYNSNLYNLIGSSSNDLNYLNGLDAFNPYNNQNNGNQHDRYLHIRLQNRQTQELYDVVNVHFKWQSSPQAIAAALAAHANQFSNFIVMGDFNSNMSTAPVPGMTSLISTNGSFSLKGPNTTDAIIYKLTPIVNYATPSINTPSSNLNMEERIKKNISGCLQDNVRILMQDHSDKFGPTFERITTMDFKAQKEHWEHVLGLLIAVFSKRYEGNINSELNVETSVKITNHISGCMQSNVRTLISLYPNSFKNIFDKMVEMTPNRSSGEFEAQKTKWYHLINYLASYI